MESQPERQPSSGALSQADHDTLIELKTIVKGFLEQYKTDMKELKDGIKLRVDDHEMRIKTIEDDIVAMGGSKTAWERFILVEKWVNEFQLRWKTIVLVATTIGSVVTVVLGIIGKVLGLIK